MKTAFGSCAMDELHVLHPTTPRVSKIGHRVEVSTGGVSEGDPLAGAILYGEYRHAVPPGGG